MSPSSVEELGWTLIQLPQVQGHDEYQSHAAHLRGSAMC